MEKKKYTIHTPLYPTAQETKNLTLAQIEKDCEEELIFIFTSIRIAGLKNEVETGELPEHIEYYLREKGYSVKSFVEASRAENNEPTLISW